MKSTTLLAIIVLVSAIGYSVEVLPGQVLVLSPEEKVVSGGQGVFLGTVGPGQSLHVTASPFVHKGGKFGLGGRWDQLALDEAPAGWSLENSGELSNPLQAKITVAPNTPDGQYTVMASVIDNSGQEQIGGMVSFVVMVNVSRDVLEASVSPFIGEAGAGQPAVYYVQIENRGSASDVFEISSSGIPLWNYSKSVFVASHSQKVVPYEVVLNEEKTLPIRINVKSSSSSELTREMPVQLSTHTSLRADLKAISRGMLTFPLAEGPVYALLGLLGGFF